MAGARGEIQPLLMRDRQWRACSAADQRNVQHFVGASNDTQRGLPGL